VAIWIALVGTGLPATWKAFMAWFGPKGVATMTFSLLVLADAIPGNERLFNIAALCVFASILAHGLTDTPGAEWIAGRSEPAGDATRAAQPAPAR
jgi:NhaP-type Na+/H+ or K+/H+ antiporter